jgi:hypothetical protein
VVHVPDTPSVTSSSAILPSLCRACTKRLTCHRTGRFDALPLTQALRNDAFLTPTSSSIDFKCAKCFFLLKYDVYPFQSDRAFECVDASTSHQFPIQLQPWLLAEPSWRLCWCP